MLTRYVRSNTIEEILYGDDKIKRIQILRKPIYTIYARLLELFSCFTFFQGLEERNIHELYHVKMILHLDARVLELEKDMVVRLHEYDEVASAETIEVDMKNREIPLTQLLARTESFMGEVKYNGYSASNNCCQDFVLCILLANGLYDAFYGTFVKQDVRELFSPFMIISSNFVTNGVRWFYNWFRT